MNDSQKLDAHIFICTNVKDGKPSCGPKGGAQLKDKVKEACRGLSGTFRVNASGCLGPCEKGINAVIYPEGKWFNQLTVNDENILVTEMKKALEGK